MEKRVTIRDISRHAGVSPATVSNVLNGRTKHVSARTAAAVLKVVDELGYDTGTSLRGSHSRTRETLGLVVASIVSPLFAHAVSGAEAVASRFGYRVILCNNHGSEDAEASSAQTLIDREVDGIIFISSSTYRQQRALQLVQEAGLPYVIINRLTDPAVGLHLLVENEVAAFEATAHLIELGHRSIGCIHLPTSGPKATLAARERLQGFRRALQTYGLEEVPAWIRRGMTGDPGFAVGYSMMASMLTEKRYPTAVVCGTDQIAMGAMRAVSERGLRVPHDVSIIGNDDMPAACYVTPALTTVRQPMEAMGGRATEALIQHLWRRVPLEGVERFPCELLVRESTAPIVEGRPVVG